MVTLAMQVEKNQSLASLYDREQNEDAETQKLLLQMGQGLGDAGQNS